jgi:ribosomal protein L37AE/L43A
MLLYCPNCNHQKEVARKSRYNVFTCDNCRHKFRGIHAVANKAWGTATAIFWNFIPFSTHYEDFDSTPCPYCLEAVFQKGAAWPTVCSQCTRSLPTDNANETVAG